MTFNVEKEDLTPLLDKDRVEIKETNDFKYLGSWIKSSKKDMNTRIAIAWNANKKLKNLWNSDLERKKKINFFESCVESVLLYASETWTLNKEMERKWTELTLNC